jgi:cytoskeletal protein RodZ
MNKVLKKQDGNVLVIVTIILVVAILAILAFVAWNSFMKPSSNSSPQQSSNAKTSNSNEGYTVVQEWGVRFKNSNELDSTEVQQERVVSSDANPQVSYTFTTARIKALGGACSSGTFSHTEILTRYADKPVSTPDGELLNDTPIAGYYYVLSAPAASCTVVDSEGALKQGATESPVELNDQSALKDSIKTLSLLR